MKAPRRLRNRRGSALLLVLVAMVVLAILASASMMTALQEARSSRAAQIQQRALTVAEFALNQQLANWTAQRRSLALGAIDSIAVGVALGDTAIVRVQRLTQVDFNIVSVGRAGIGSGLMEAQREVSMLVRMSSPTIRTPGLLTVSDNLQVQGSSLIDGTNRIPSGWTTCGATAGSDTVAIAYRSTHVPEIGNGNQSSSNGNSNNGNGNSNNGNGNSNNGNGNSNNGNGNSNNGSGGGQPSLTVGALRVSPAAADTSTYSVFGDATWASLTGSATIRLTSTSPNPAPIGTATSCTASSSNWGEPNRGAGSVVGCQSTFPVIYAPGNLSISSGRGQGVLLVEGSLTITGSFYWVGIIIVRGALDVAGSPTLMGSVMVRSTTGADSRITGNARLQFSSCAAQQALGGLGSLVRTGGRSWANVY